MSFSTPIVKRMLERPEGPHGGSGNDLYTVEQGAIFCHLCRHRSANPKDVHNRFCPHCRIFFEDFVYMRRLDKGLRARFEPGDADWHRLQA